MKKSSTKTTLADGDNMRAEYDFTVGTRGKHNRAMQAGYTSTIYRADGTKEVKEIKPQEGAVVLAPDGAGIFP
jgi:hypothetical protein